MRCSAGAAGYGLHQLLAALLRRLGWRARLVHALRPLPLRAAPNEAVYHVPTTASDAAGPPGPAPPLAAADAAAQQPTAWIEAYAADAARWIGTAPGAVALFLFFARAS